MDFVKILHLYKEESGAAYDIFKSKFNTIKIVNLDTKQEIFLNAWVIKDLSVFFAEETRKQFEELIKIHL